MKKITKIIIAVLICTMLLASFAACGQPDKPDEGKVYTGEMLENGNTYADNTWFPVVKTPITVEAVVREENDIGPWECRSIFQEIAETTGVTFNLQVFTLNENESLMFASRNYPDCAFRLHNVGYAYDEARTMGELVELTDEMLEKYAPNWYELFTTYPEIYALTLHSDGKLYNLPQIMLEESRYMLRDLNVINVTWLDELGLEKPTTTEEFTTYLRAVKNAAGQGSIPSNVTPLWMRNHVDICSYYAIMDWFGVYQGFAYEIIKDGKAFSNMDNPDIKPAIRYIADLWAEGLINSDFEKASWDDHVHNIYDNAQKGSPTVGAYFAFDIASDDYEAFAPLDTGTGAPSYSHDFSYESRLQTDTFGIFKSSQYPIAILRAIDHYAQGENAVRAQIGEQGNEKQWYYDDEGDMVLTDTCWDGEPEWNGWNDYGPSIVNEELSAQLHKNLLDENTRIAWYYKMYKGTLPTNMQKFPQIALKELSAEEQSEADLIWSRLNNVNNTFVKKWIKGSSDIDDDWDTYVNALKGSGLARRLELLQKAYDLYLEGI